MQTNFGDPVTPNQLAKEVIIQLIESAPQKVYTVEQRTTKDMEVSIMGKRYKCTKQELSRFWGSYRRHMKTINKRFYDPRHCKTKFPLIYKTNKIIREANSYTFSENRYEKDDI